MGAVRPRVRPMGRPMGTVLSGSFRSAAENANKDKHQEQVFPHSSLVYGFKHIGIFDCLGEKGFKIDFKTFVIIN